MSASRKHIDKHDKKEICPFISIILVCLNRSDTIERTLQSIVTLDYPRREVIVIDGNSTDGTIDILNKYSGYIDYLSIESDNGIYDAMNKGIKVAKGDFCYFLGADDIIVNSWKNLIGKLKTGNFIYYGNVYLPSTNRIYDGKFSRLKLLRKNICHQAIFYPASVFKKYEYNSEYLYLADHHLNLLLMSDRSFKFRHVNLLIAVYSEKGVTTKHRDFRFLNDQSRIIKQNYSIILFLYFLLITRVLSFLKLMKLKLSL